MTYESERTMVRIAIIALMCINSFVGVTMGNPWIRVLVFVVNCFWWFIFYLTLK